MAVSHSLKSHCLSRGLFYGQRLWMVFLVLTLWPTDLAFSQISIDEEPAAQQLPEGPPPVEHVPWWKRPFKKEEPPVDVDRVINRGPRRYAPSEGALFRLPQGIRLPAGQWVRPGFYLAKVRGEGDATRTLQLFYGKTFITELPLSRLVDPKEEPVEYMSDGSGQPFYTVEAQMVDEGSGDLSMSIVLQEILNGRKHLFQSTLLPIQTDARPQLQY